MRFAIVENGKVVNIAVADAALEPTWVESESAEIGDAYTNGVFQAFDPLQDAEATEAQANAIRTERNAKLSASDWTQVADAPVDKTAWAAYRQALRDITAQTGFPWDVQWPTQPE